MPKHSEWHWLKTVPCSSCILKYSEYWFAG